MPKKLKRTTATDVRFRDPKPNPLFTPYQTFITKFIHYTRPVKCAYCGRMGKHHWTQLVFFRIAEGFENKVRGKVVAAQSFTLKGGKELFPPLTPVCGKHILEPDI